MRESEPRWPALLAALAVGLLAWILPAALTLGPRWLPFSVIAALMFPTLASHRAGHTRLNDLFGYSLLGVLTLVVASSLTLLIFRLPSHADSPGELLRSAGALWLSNVLVFASWYWRLDGGGPNQRVHHEEPRGAFLFPQMLMDKKLRQTLHQENWSPGFIDYLFLAFNTSTAFSPTDVPVLTRWAKVMMIIQSTISLTTLALIAARAVDIL